MAGLEDGEFEDLLITDEANLGANPFGPEEVERDSLLITTEPQPATQEEMSESEIPEEEEPLPEFDPRFKQDFEGLLYLGYLRRTFHWMGHEFVIETINSDDLLEIGLIHAQYAGTIADVKAYQALVCAASVASLDGKVLPMPISSDVEDTELINKFRLVLKWFPVTLDAVYEEYLKLEIKVRDIVEAMGKA